jgi:hypothetical protein
MFSTDMQDVLSPYVLLASHGMDLEKVQFRDASAHVVTLIAGSRIIIVC